MGSGPVSTRVEAKRLIASDRERVSPSESEPDSASLRSLCVANLPRMMKPEAHREATTESTCGAHRGGWGERARKEASRNLGDPAVWVGPDLGAEHIRFLRARTGVGGAHSSEEAG
jgi:hypothetical protein